METKLPPERKESVDVVWYPVSFLDSSCLLPGINYLPSVVPCSCIVAKVSERSVL